MVVRDLDEIREAAPMSQFERGRRDESDPSYALFRDLRFLG